MTTCSNCTFCLQVYRRFLLAFGDFKGHYYCEKFNKMTDKDGYCKLWQRKENNFDFSKQRFDEIAEDIKYNSEYLKNQSDK